MPSSYGNGRKNIAVSLPLDIDECKIFFNGRKWRKSNGIIPEGSTQQSQFSIDITHVLVLIVWREIVCALDYCADHRHQPSVCALDTITFFVCATNKIWNRINPLWTRNREIEPQKSISNKHLHAEAWIIIEQFILEFIPRANVCKFIELQFCMHSFRSILQKPLAFAKEFIRFEKTHLQIVSKYATLCSWNI